MGRAWSGRGSPSLVPPYPYPRWAPHVVYGGPHSPGVLRSLLMGRCVHRHVCASVYVCIGMCVHGHVCASVSRARLQARVQAMACPRGCRLRSEGYAGWMGVAGGRGGDGCAAFALFVHNAVVPLHPVQCARSVLLCFCLTWNRLCVCHGSVRVRSYRVQLVGLAGPRCPVQWAAQGQVHQHQRCVVYCDPNCMVCCVCC